MATRPARKQLGWQSGEAWEPEGWRGRPLGLPFFGKTETLSPRRTPLAVGGLGDVADPGGACPGSGNAGAMLSSEQALSELLVRKEEEWRALQARRNQLQEAALQDTQRQLEEAQGKLQRLQEDFVYNLQVLEERDRELEHYDAVFVQARGQEESRQAEVSELKIEVSKLKQELAREARRAEELREQLRLRSQEHRLELDRMHSDKNGELDHQREQYENLKWRLERKLEELDGELALQRQELLLEFESQMQKKEHEFRLQADRMSNTVLAHELKVKLLSKELEALKVASVQAAECLQKAETANAELEQKLQGCAWELRDLEAVKDARIKDLEDTLHSVQLTRKREEETFNRKHEELDRLARERDAVLVAVKGAHAEQLRATEAQVQELQAQCVSLEVQLRRAEWAQADATKEKDAVIDRLRDEAAALKAGWDAQVTQMSKEAVSRDLQAQALQEEEVKLKAQLASTQQDVDRYKQQLSRAVERERSLERDQVQLGLDWQRRCDDIERDQIQRSEALIQGLTDARDQVVAKLQETEQALREQEAVLKAVTLERDTAEGVLRTHGLFPGQELQMPLKQHREEVSKDFPSREIQRLQEQNTSLRKAVAQMRQEMETLSNQMPPPGKLAGETSDSSRPDPGAGGDAAPPHYVLALEAEMRDLKHKLKGLEEQLEGTQEPTRMLSGCTDRQPRVHSSTEAAGDSVHAGWGLPGLVLRKLRDRVRLLTLLVTQLKKKVWQRPLELDTVQWELPQEVDQVYLEVLELGKQMAELGKHLGTAQQEEWEPSDRKSLRKEACSVLTSSTVRVSESCSLGSSMGGMEPQTTLLQGLADGTPMGPEDQEEFSRHPQPGAQPLQPWSVPHLQRKLREATRKIISLHLQREQLIEMGNRLRAELGHRRGRPRGHSLPPRPEAQDPGDAPMEPGEALGQLQPHAAAQDPKLPMTNCVPGRGRRSRPSSAQPLSRNPALRGSKAGPTAGPVQRQHRIPSVTCRSTHQKENRAPKPPEAQAAPEENGRQSHGSSSLASWSLQDTWRLLDLGSSPSGPPSQDESAAEAPAALGRQEADGSPVRMRFQETLTIEGMKMAAQSRTRPTRSSSSHPARLKSCQPPPRIRNYNVKD